MNPASQSPCHEQARRRHALGQHGACDFLRDAMVERPPVVGVDEIRGGALSLLPLGVQRRRAFNLNRILPVTHVLQPRLTKYRLIIDHGISL